MLVPDWVRECLRDEVIRRHLDRLPELRAQLYRVGHDRGSAASHVVSCPGIVIAAVVCLVADIIASRLVMVLNAHDRAPARPGLPQQAGNSVTGYPELILAGG
jgi:hypothetical protein